MKFDWLGFIGIALMLVGAGFLSYHFIVNRISTCTANPVTYTAEYLMEGKNYSYNYIEIRVYTSSEDLAPVQTFKFFKDGSQRRVMDYKVDTSFLDNITLAK